MAVSMFLTTIIDLMSKLWYLQLFLVAFVTTELRRKAAYLVRGMFVLYDLWKFASSFDFWIRLACFTKILDSCILFSFSDPKRFFFSVRWIAHAALNHAHEVLIFCLPLPILGLLILPLSQKLWVCIAYSLGVL